MGGSMSSVIISGDTSGSITLSAPAVAGTNTITLPASTGTVLTTGSPQSGAVVQTVGATYATAVSITSVNPTWASAGLTASITPKFSTSKIAVFVTGVCGIAGGSSSLFFTIFRGSTNLGNVTGASSPYFLNRNYSAASGGSSGRTVSMNYFDSPATTSATAYTVYCCVDSGTGYFNRIDAAADVGMSQIILMEIAV